MTPTELQEYFDCLGLEPGASPEAVKAAYRQKVQAYPPATHPQEFKAIRKAYDILKDPNNHTIDPPNFWVPEVYDQKPSPELIAQIRSSLAKESSSSLETLIRLSF